MTTKTRTAAAFALVLALLAGGPANALPRDGRITPAAQESAGLFAPLWNWLARLVAPGGLTAVWGEEGGMMDPNGQPLDEGPGMDPNGAPDASTGQGDEGGMMDPNG